MEENCHVTPIQKSLSEEEMNDAVIAALAVSGMGCVNCATRVRNGLLAVDGVVSADVDHARGIALVDYVPAKTNVDALVRAVANAGNDGKHSYRAQTMS